MPAAVTTDAQVCNQALGYVGHRAVIGSLLEQSTEAQACATHYQTAKNAILEAFPWRWATARATLAQFPANITREGYARVFAAPRDMVSANSARQIEDGGRPSVDPIPFLVELDSSGAYFIIATDAEVPRLIYTRDVEVALWPAKAIDALATELAVRLALTLPVKPELAARLVPLATLKLREAMAVTANGESPDKEPDAPSIQARR